MDLNIIPARYREQMLLGRKAGAEGKVRDLLKAHRPDGTWENSTEVGSGTLKHNHLSNVATLSREYAHPESPLHRDAKLLQTTRRGLGAWLVQRPRHKNWWHNEIGAPRHMRDIIIALGPDLGDQREDALEVLRQFDVKGTGANLMWSADLALHYAALTGDAGQVSAMAQRLAQEVVIGAPEGIQVDYSFFQHDARLQQFHYGGAFLADNVRLAWQLRGTPWAYPAGKVAILRNYVLEGCQWMQRDGYTIPSTQDRAATRQNALRLNFQDRLRQLAELDPAHAEQFQLVDVRMRAETLPELGFRHFQVADFSTYHTPGFSFFVKTISDRTLPTESINQENLKGRMFTWGDTYFLRDGQEYFNLLAVWDWDRVPGVTLPAGVTRGGANILRQAFTGGLSNGQSGFSVMDYQLDGGQKEPILKARKAWFSHDDRVLCLISADGAPDLRTAMDQSRQRGEIRVGRKDIPIGLGKSGELSVDWIWHHGLTYLTFGAEVEIQSGPVTADWREINRDGPAEPITESVFLPVLRHGAAAHYMVAASASPVDAGQLAAAPGFTLLRNDATAQAVEYKDGTMMAALWQAGELELAGIRLVATRPCLVMVQAGRLYVSDPTQVGAGLVTASRGMGAPVEVALVAGGVTYSVKFP